MSGLQLFELAQRFDNVSILFDVLQTIHHESNGRTELLPAVNEKLDTEQATTEQFSEGATTVDFRIVPNFIRWSDELYLAILPTKISLDVNPTSFSECEVSLPEKNWRLL